MLEICFKESAGLYKVLWKLNFYIYKNYNILYSILIYY